MRKYGAWAMAAALLCSTHAMAQDIRAQERAVDSASARVARAKARVMAIEDSLARRAQTYDSISFGAVRILVEPRWRSLAEVAGRAASAQLTAAMPEQVSRLSRSRFVVKSESDRDTSDWVGLYLSRPGQQRGMEAYLKADSATLTRQFVSIGARFIALSMDVKLRVWAQGLLLSDTLTDAEWLRYRVDLVSADAVVARKCFSGDMRACLLTLGLAPTIDPVLEWYDASDRRAIVKREMDFRPPGYRVQAEHCANGDDPACIEVLGHYAEYLQSPVHKHIRGSLVSVALQLGGASAYDRLLTASGTPTQSLETVATVSMDSVVRAWQNRIRETRMPSDSMSLQIAFASVFWIGLCGGLSLRSTRWR